MNRELQDKLFEEFPVFFRERHLDRRESAMSGYSICIRDEWFEPFHTFCKAVQEINKTRSEEEAIVAQQVKEKWYRITVYTNQRYSEEPEAYKAAYSALCEACPPEPRLSR